MGALKADKTESFKLNIEDSDLFHVVRTGVIGDGSCFFHALLRAKDSGYKHAVDEVKMDKVNYLRELCAKAVPELYADMGNGEHKRLAFMTKFVHYMEQMKYPDDPVGKSLNENVPLALYQSIIEELSSSSSFCHNFKQKLLLKLDPYYHGYVSDHFDTIFTDIYNECVRDYADTILKNLVDQTHLEIISRVTKTNFIIVSSDTGDVYPGAVNIINEDWDTIVILYLKDYEHYEIIGVMDETHYVTRKFPKSHPFLSLLRRDS